MDEETAQQAYRSTLIRLAVFTAVAAVLGVGAIVLGLNRSGVDRVVYLGLGALMLVCGVGMAGAALRSRARERRLPPEQVAEERAARMAEAERRTAATDERRWLTVLNAALGVFWLVYLAVGLSNGSWRQVAVSGFFVLLVVGTEVSRRRRRRQRSGHGLVGP
jgi:hypothetical protein